MMENSFKENIKHISENITVWNFIDWRRILCELYSM